jgi:cytochrome c peroxidase
MRKIQFLFIGGGLILSFFLVQCAKDSPSNNNSSASYPNVLAAFGSSIDLNNLVNYAGQSKPSYIVKGQYG